MADAAKKSGVHKEFPQSYKIFTSNGFTIVVGDIGVILVKIIDAAGTVSYNKSKGWENVVGKKWLVFKKRNDIGSPENDLTELYRELKSFFMQKKTHVKIYSMVVFDGKVELLMSAGIRYIKALKTHEIPAFVSEQIIRKKPLRERFIERLSKEVEEFARESVNKGTLPSSIYNYLS